MGKIKLRSFVSDMMLGGDLIILQALKTCHDSGAYIAFLNFKNNYAKGFPFARSAAGF